MSWLTDFLSALKPSSREEHFWAKIAGEEELENEYLPSSREEGFMYKIAEKVSAGGGSGGGGSLYVVNFDASTGRTDKTAGEIFAHLETDRVIFRSQSGGADGLEMNSAPICYSVGGGVYMLVINVLGEYASFVAESASDYMRAGG